MNDKIKILGLSGKIGSGKDTGAELIATLCETPVERHAFADKVREATQLITGYDLKVIHHGKYGTLN